MKRRQFFQNSALVTSGALVGCATPGIAANSPKTPFTVPATYIPIVGSDEMFPIRRIYCIGRNYAAHAREMGSDPTREPPFFFQKPTDAIQYVTAGTVADHPYPTLTKNYHYEAELVAVLGKGGRNIPVDKALDLVYGYTLGLDMTRRDLQRGMGDQKKPWEIGKSFDKSAPHRRRAQSGTNGSLHQGRHLAQGEWSSETKSRFEPNDLVSGRANQQTLRSI